MGNADWIKYSTNQIIEGPLPTINKKNKDIMVRKNEDGEWIECVNYGTCNMNCKLRQQDCMKKIT